MCDPKIVFFGLVGFSSDSSRTSDINNPYISSTTGDEGRPGKIRTVTLRFCLDQSVHFNPHGSFKVPEIRPPPNLQSCKLLLSSWCPDCYISCRKDPTLNDSRLRFFFLFWWLFCPSFLIFFYIFVPLFWKKVDPEYLQNTTKKRIRSPSLWK